jgi:pilus assembly protein Flp/PilA
LLRVGLTAAAGICDRPLCRGRPQLAAVGVEQLMFVWFDNHFCGDIAMNLLNKVRRFLKSEDGPTAVEYAVMLALIVIVCLVSITAIGNNANQTFDSVAQALTAAS